MDYLILTKQQYDESYQLKRAGDPAAASRELEECIRRGEEPILAQEIEFSFRLEIGKAPDEVPADRVTVKRPARKVTEEVKEGEVNQDQTEQS